MAVLDGCLAYVLPQTSHKDGARSQTGLPSFDIGYAELWQNLLRDYRLEVTQLRMESDAEAVDWYLHVNLDISNFYFSSLGSVTFG